MSKSESSNFILHAKSKQFYWEGNGQLSIKTFSNGKAHYKTNYGFYTVEESRYLLLNEGPYTISIEEITEVESFCIFFKDGFAGEVFRALKEKNDTLLTDPYKEIDSIDFFDKTFHKNNALSAQLQSFKQALPGLEMDTAGYEEPFHIIMQSLLNEHFHAYKEMESLKAVRPSTREELYKRISIAHDYIRSYFHTPLKLNEIAQIACLSANHLLRAYYQIYGKTPHQHISEFRVQKAR